MAQLFIIEADGRTAITAEKLCDMFNINMDKIVKNPLFKNNKNKRNKKNYLGSRAGSHIIPIFRAKHPDTGIEMTIRYAESWVTDPKNKNEYKYHPGRIVFSGENFRQDNNKELAVWFYLNKHFSPKVEYEFVDTLKNAQDSIANVDILERALVKARTTPDAQLTLLLKGLSRAYPGQLGNIDMMEIAEQRAAFKNFAVKLPKEFLEKVEGSNMAAVEGSIIQLIDKGGIALMQDGPWRVWKWAAGPKIGQPIGDVIKEYTADTTSLLVAEILSRPEEYKEALQQALQRVYETSVAKHKEAEWGDFSTADATASLEELTSKEGHAKKSDDIITDVVKGRMEVPSSDIQSVREFCDKYGFSKASTDVAMMRSALDQGVINQENIELWCQKNLKLSKKDQ